VTALRFDALFVVCLLGAAVPLALGLLPRLRLPSAVLEIAAGVIIGPSVLGWIEPDEPVLVAALLGLAALLFLAGLEIDVSQAGRRELSLAVAGYAVTLVLAAVVAGGLASVGWIDSPALVAIALSATSLGLVVPVLKDAGRAQSALGQVVIVGSSTADVASIVLLSVLFGAEGGAASRFVLLLSFCAVVVAIAAGAMGVRRSPRTRAVIEALQDSTAQIRIRLSLVLLVGLTALAARVGLETILGAFLAGVVLSVLDRRPQEHPRLRTGLDAIGFGFLIPVFYVTTGLQLDIGELVASPAALLQVPVLMLGLIVVRGVPAVLHIRTLGLRSSIAVGLLQATSLPFLVAAAMVGRELALVSSTTASALIASGVLSVALFPAAAYALLGTADEALPAPKAPDAPRR
jgi:Kef-type K+ transport system membrane component KefB